MSTRIDAVIRIDKCDSEGEPLSPMFFRNVRLMALKVSNNEPLWFGFVVMEAADGSDVLSLGVNNRVSVAFINDIDATKAFWSGASYLIGDGIRTIGVIRLVNTA